MLPYIANHIVHKHSNAMAPKPFHNIVLKPLSNIVRNPLSNIACVPLNHIAPKPLNNIGPKSFNNVVYKRNMVYKRVTSSLAFRMAFDGLCKELGTITCEGVGNILLKGLGDDSDLEASKAPSFAGYNLILGSMPPNLPGFLNSSN